MDLGSSPYDPPTPVCETSNKLFLAPEPPFSHLENGRGTDHISLGCCRDQMSQCVFNFWHRPGPRSPFLGVCCSFWGWAARSCSPAASGIPGWSGPPSSSGQNACFHVCGTWPSWPCWSPEMAVDAPELCGLMSCCPLGSPGIQPLHCVSQEPGGDALGPKWECPIPTAGPGALTISASSPTLLCPCKEAQSPLSTVACKGPPNLSLTNA